MRNLDFIQEVRRRLLRQGFGRSYANRAASELRDHWLDLFDEGLRQGLSRSDAELRAGERMGKPDALAAEISARLQPVSFLGRYPTFTFGALALVATVVWWGALMLAAASATGIIGSAPDGGPLPATDTFSACVDWIRAGSYLAVPWAICFISRRYFCGWKPALWGCLLAGIHNGAHWLVISQGESGHGSITWAYGVGLGGPALVPVLAPICVFLIFWWWNSRPESEAKRLEYCIYE